MSRKRPPVPPAPDITADMRWRRRVPRFRPPGEMVKREEYGVDQIAGKNSDKKVKSFVLEHHYAAKYPSAQERFGLYRAGPLGSTMVGVAVFSVPQQQASIPAWCGVPPDEGMELGRFVLLDSVPFNGETLFLAQVFTALRELRPRVRAILSYSDPVPYTTIEGKIRSRGHVGSIYQGLGAVYHGRSSRQVIHLLPDGSTLSERSMAKIVAQHKGCLGAERDLIRAGFPRRLFSEDPREYVTRIKADPRLRIWAHPGKHVFTWHLDGTVAGDFHGPRQDLPYPKRTLEIP